MSKRRVVVTGLGAVTPIGNNVEDFWAGIREGKVGIGPITKFDTTDYKVKIAAEVKDFNAKDHMDPRAARRMDPFCQYAVTAAKEAFEDAGLDMEKEDSFRVGVIVGSGIGSLPQVENNYEKILTKGPGKVNPLMVPMMISNMAAGNISIQLGLRGKCTDVVTACASGTHSIGDAFRAIQYGDAEIMLAGGTESCICPTGVAGFTALTALTKTEDAARASIPFDKEVVLCLVKVPASWSLRNWSMRRQEAQGSTPSLSVTVQQLMLSISLLRQRTEQAQQEQWNWQWKKPAYSHLRWNTSTHMEQARTTTTCLRQERSTRHLEMRQKIWL